MEEILNRRNIQSLFHFTRVENLSSIFVNGIVPRGKLIKNDIVATVNDENRFDRCTNANCTSVEFPNYKMFYRLRRDNPETEWVVLKLDASIITDFKCAFCYSNAGSREIFNIPLMERMGEEAFENIFAERRQYYNRETLEIPDYYPTNPQAEVLVFGTIPIQYIKCVIFDDRYTLNKYKNLIPEGMEYTVDSDYFKWRHDFEYWR